MIRSSVSCGKRQRNPIGTVRRVLLCLVLPLALAIGVVRPTWAQSSYTPVVITPPIVDEMDDNHVSMFSGKPHFTVPALKFGDVSFTPYSFNGGHFQQGGLADNNYGRIVPCLATSGQGTSYAGTFECAVFNSDALQVIYGEERATFHLSGGQYTPDAGDGSTFADNGTSCTWTKADGTRVVFAAYHDSGDPLCLSQNVTSITYPDGRIATYYYYGSFSTTAQSPILSIATNSGYLLKYNYSGTPAFGSETSVTAINRAFETCDPAAVSCTLTASWPTANVSWQPISASPCDNFPSLGGSYNSCTHYIFTIEEASHRKHIFQLDSYMRIISYQPPGATSAVFNYTLCSNLVGGALANCFGYPQYPWHPQVFEPQPLMFDLAASVTRNGQVWNYSPFFTPGGGGGQSYSTWTHYVGNPLGKTRSASGNATPGTELYWGPIENLSEYDGTVYTYERSVINTLGLATLPSGIKKLYTYVRRNVSQITQSPVSGSPLSPLTQSAAYANPCSNLVICNKPTSVVDANGYQTDFTYDPTHGGVLTETDPAAPNGIRPQIRRTYVQRYAWYLNSAGTMTRETNPVWLLSTESYCRTTAASGSSCTTPSDEVVTSYDYGPDSGPNNLMLRGKTVTGDGVTLRTCYAHDHQGNVIWQTSPNASPASCPTY